MCAEPVQGVGDNTDKSGKQRDCVQAFALELGAQNQQGTNLDIGIEISFMQTIE